MSFNYLLYVVKFDSIYTFDAHLSLVSDRSKEMSSLHFGLAKFCLLEASVPEFVT